MSTWNIKRVFKVVDGVRQTYPTPWGALVKGDHVMLEIPESSREECDGNKWEVRYGTDHNVFILAEDSFLNIYPAALRLDDPQDLVERYDVWAFPTNNDGYKYQENENVESVPDST